MIDFDENIVKPKYVKCKSNFFVQNVMPVI